MEKEDVAGLNIDFAALCDKYNVDSFVCIMGSGKKALQMSSGCDRGVWLRIKNYMSAVLRSDGHTVGYDIEMVVKKRKP